MAGGESLSILQLPGSAPIDCNVRKELVSSRYTYRDGGDNNLMDFIDEGEVVDGDLLGGESEEMEFGEVERGESRRSMFAATAAMPKADGLRSLTPISSAVADKPLIECHVKHSSWMGERDFVVFVVGRHRVDSGIYGMGGTGGSGTYGIYGIYLWNFRRSLPTD
ncbi:hypothetical protein V501_02157 [Pseudogymnoascus sp. VKM F-4519 (FW-2642)]|nr:hypothetical protein V501_02157 [Pseudogymnoascus sp. VKM F-4519 (FW-2642)]